MILRVVFIRKVTDLQVGYPGSVIFDNKEEKSWYIQLKGL